jgi:Asp-tRNA(Asn)/Glu-tRNA(Gln) amidotransferase A subunit family amidase
VPLSFTFDTPGLLARSVCDLAYGFAALDPAGIDPPALIARAGTRDLAGIRIGVGDPFLWRDCDPGIAETADEAVNALARAGAVTSEYSHYRRRKPRMPSFSRAASAPSSCATSSTGNCRTGWRSSIRSSRRRCATPRP